MAISSIVAIEAAADKIKELLVQGFKHVEDTGDDTWESNGAIRVRIWRFSKSVFTAEIVFNAGNANIKKKES